MPPYKKIDLYFKGDYVCSTIIAKTCKQAVRDYLTIVENSKHSFCGTTRLQEMILKRPQDLKAYFAKK